MSRLLAALSQQNSVYLTRSLFLALAVSAAVEKPPTILFRHRLGPIAQSNDGKLIVYPGVVLHMECLWIRRFGTPKWSVSHSYRWADCRDL